MIGSVAAKALPRTPVERFDVLVGEGVLQRQHGQGMPYLAKACLRAKCQPAAWAIRW